MRKMTCADKFCASPSCDTPLVTKLHSSNQRGCGELSPDPNIDVNQREQNRDIPHPIIGAMKSSPNPRSQILRRTSRKE
jgi:hypothetical protein